MSGLVKQKQGFSYVPNVRKDPKSIRKFSETCDKMAIYRSYGGLGDILMHRMFFKHLKNIADEKNTNIDLYFICPEKYRSAVLDHPSLKCILDINDFVYDDYARISDTSRDCTRYETRHSEDVLNFYKGLTKDKSKLQHRSDIWVKVSIDSKSEFPDPSHDMLIALSDEEKEFGINYLKKLTNNTKNKILVFNPISAMESKNLLFDQVKCVVEYAQKNDFTICGIHNKPIEDLNKLNIPVATGLTIREWMGVLAAADGVISVDSAAFHFAGGYGSHVLGIFTWADSEIYKKYYKNVYIVQKHIKNGDWSCGPCYTWQSCKNTKRNISTEKGCCHRPNSRLVCQHKPCLTEIDNNMLEEGLRNLFSKICN